MLIGDILFSLFTAMLSTIFTAPFFSVINNFWTDIYNSLIAFP